MIPFPSEDVTPPVTKICLAVLLFLDAEEAISQYLVDKRVKKGLSNDLNLWGSKVA